MNKTILLYISVALFSISSYATAQSTQNKGIDNIYIGYGVSNINGTSQNDKFIMNVANFVIGKNINKMLDIEVSALVGNPEDNNYKLRHGFAANLIANWEIPESPLAIIAKLGINSIEFRRTNGTILEATDANYGLGLRYTYDSELFIDGAYEQLVNKTINNRDEDIKQLSINMKHRF